MSDASGGCILDVGRGGNIKRFIQLVVALLLSAPPSTSAQTAGRGVFPSQKPGEYGPREAAPDGLVLADHLIAVKARTTGEGGSDIKSVGAFRIVCAPGHTKADDPVVYPNRPGRAHWHQFYGNSAVDAFSTYESIRATGQSTCRNPLNRSGYWAPGMTFWDAAKNQWMGMRPDYVSLYYKREPKTSRLCDPGDRLYVGICVGIPNAVRFITGYDMAARRMALGRLLFKCVTPAGTNRSEFGPDMVTTAATCQIGDSLVLYIDGPECWDGVNLDSPNHMSHVADRVDNSRAPGYLKCPSTHPYYWPHFTLQAGYLVTSALDRSGTWKPGMKTYYLSSDRIAGMPVQRPGSTFHADYLEGWNPWAKKAWQDNCIDRLLSCAGGDFGNGYAMKEEWPLKYSADNPGKRISPLPAIIQGSVTGDKLHASH